MSDITYIDVDELTVRIAEACISVKRPQGLTPQEALGQLRVANRDCVEGFERAAFAAAKYIAECCNAELSGLGRGKNLPDPNDFRE